MRVKVFGVWLASVSMKLRNSSDGIVITITTTGISFSPINLATLDLWVTSQIDVTLNIER
jgi:hypothetical protein